VSNRVRRVRATDLAQMGFCEQACLLKETLGDVDTRESADAKRRGNAEHERFHVQVSAHHNQSRKEAGASDRRCFIASAVYGVDDPRTEQLRRFRDGALATSRAGRLLVTLYYRVSPSIADTLCRFPRLRPIAGRVLDIIRRRIAPSYSKDADHDHQPPEHPRA